MKIGGIFIQIWAILHKKLGLFAVAYDFHVRTIDEAKAVLDWKTVENGYHGLGTMYSLMSQFDKSIECYNESIHAAQQYHNEKGILLSKQNISNVFMKAGNLDMASLHIEETYQLAKLQKDTARIAAVLRIYGQIEKAKGNLQGALSKHLEALVWFKHKPNKSIVAETYLGIAVINMELGKNGCGRILFFAI